MEVTQRTLLPETSGVGNTPRHDVIIIGDGLIGLSIAQELSRAGVRCCVVGARRTGAASLAAAGLLAPTSDSLPPQARAFFAGSLHAYPRFLAHLQPFDAGLEVLSGLIEVLRDGADAATNGQLLARDELAALEPALLGTSRAVFHAADGAVDNVRLVRALEKAVAGESTIRWVRDDAVSSVDVSDHAARVQLSSGAELESEWLVLAAGAWSPQLAGLPRRLAVHPLKGQMLAVDATCVRHAIMAPDVYIVPRDDETVIGATVELAGFDLEIDPRALDALHAAAARVVPALGSARITRRWAGTRPATPDMLPIIGVEPRAQRLIYACGHSKNGILLAPATASAVASIVATGSAPDLSAFAPDRFAEERVPA